MEQIFYAIKTIKEIEYFVDESFDLEEQVDFYNNANIYSKIESDEIHFTISVHYRRKGTTEDYLRSKTVSVFAVQQLKALSTIKNGVESVDLPDPLWITFFSISFSHARAMLAKSAAGTKYSHLIMPLINPEEQFRKLFGDKMNS